MKKYRPSKTHHISSIYLVHTNLVFVYIMNISKREVLFCVLIKARSRPNSNKTDWLPTSFTLVKYSFFTLVFHCSIHTNILGEPTKPVGYNFSLVWTSLKNKQVSHTKGITIFKRFLHQYQPISYPGCLFRDVDVYSSTVGRYSLSACLLPPRFICVSLKHKWT